MAQEYVDRFKVADVDGSTKEVKIEAEKVTGSKEIEFSEDFNVTEETDKIVVSLQNGGGSTGEKYLPLSGGTLTSVDKYNTLQIKRLNRNPNGEVGEVGISSFGTNANGYPVIKSEKNNYQLDLEDDLKYGKSGSQKSVARVDIENKDIVYGNNDDTSMNVVVGNTNLENTNKPHEIWTVNNVNDIVSVVQTGNIKRGALFFVLTPHV